MLNRLLRDLFTSGGNPTTKPEPIFFGKNLKEVVERDKKDEEDAIKLYKQIIKVAEDEEDHHDTFTTLLEEI